MAAKSRPRNRAEVLAALGRVAAEVPGLTPMDGDCAFWAFEQSRLRAHMTGVPTAVLEAAAALSMPALRCAVAEELFSNPVFKEALRAPENEPEYNYDRRKLIQSINDTSRVITLPLTASDAEIIAALKTLGSQVRQIMILTRLMVVKISYSNIL